MKNKYFFSAEFQEQRADAIATVQVCDATGADGSAGAGNINSFSTITAAKELLILQPCLTIHFPIF